MTNFEFKICFGKSSSRNYKRAVKLARTFSNYSEENGLHIIIIKSDEFTRLYDKIHLLWLFIDSWRSTRIFLNGEEMTPTDFRECFKGFWCYVEYTKALIQEIHCWESKHIIGWGCKCLQSIRRSYSPFSPGLFYGEAHKIMYWFEIGHLITDDLWRIDKKEIIRVLRRETELKHLELCPIFDFDKIIAAVNELPDEIDVSNDQWQIEYLHEPGCKPRAVRIKPVDDFKIELD